MICYPSRRRFMSASLAAGATLMLPVEASAGLVTVQAGEHGHFWVKAEIEGTTVDALIDTGATAVFIGIDQAERVGIQPRRSQFTSRVVTANGATVGAPVTLRRVSVGSVSVRDVEGVVVTTTRMVTLIGMSFLSRLQDFRVDGDTLSLRQ
jgi:aspartyl protease family protein